MPTTTVSRLSYGPPSSVLNARRQVTIVLVDSLPSSGSVHTLINALGRKARNLAPAAAEAALDTGCTNKRPVSGARKQLAWDLVVVQHELNRISEEVTDAYAAWAQVLLLATSEQVANESF